MAIISVPYHIHDRIDDLDLPAAGTTVTAGAATGTDPWRALLPLYDRLAETVRVAEAPAVLSGDCLVAVPVVAGLNRAGVAPSIVWFDAHGDVQAPETTASGYIGGMPLRLLVGHRPELLADPLGVAAVPQERVLLVGARDLDPPEESFLAGSRIGRAEVADLAGPTPPPLPDGPIYLHIDLDVVDAAALPGLRYPVGGGPSPAAVLAAARRVVASGRVAALTLACTWHPGRPYAGPLRAGVTELLAAYGAAPGG